MEQNTNGLILVIANKEKKYMLLDVDYKLLDVSPSNDLLNFDFSNFPWTTWVQNYKVHPEALSYQIALSNTKVTNSEVKISTDTDNQVLIDLVLNESKKLEEYYNGKIIWAVLFCLQPGKSSLPHIDRSAAFEYTHRCFLPIKTNTDSKIVINGNSYHFESGNWYEMNNMVEHQTYNNGKEDRIHLLIDVLPN